MFCAGAGVREGRGSGALGQEANQQQGGQGRVREARHVCRPPHLVRPLPQFTP